MGCNCSVVVGAGCSIRPDAVNAYVVAVRVIACSWFPGMIYPEVALGAMRLTGDGRSVIRGNAAVTVMVKFADETEP